MDDRTFAWVLFLVASTIRPTRNPASDDAIKDDIARADRMLEAFEKKFHPSGRS